MKIYPSFVVSRKIRTEQDREDATLNGKLARMGHFWWYWLPRLKWNKGRPWRDCCTEVGVMWLCFSAGVGLWRTQRAASGEYRDEF